MSGKRSKYNQISIKKLRHEKRTISMPGSQEYDGKFFRCWHCGFVGNDIDRNAVGDGDGTTYSITTLTNDPYGQGNTATKIASSGKTVLMPSSGLSFTERHDISATASSGCAFCGCRNYR
jgi:hypothetical protein